MKPVQLKLKDFLQSKLNEYGNGIRYDVQLYNAVINDRIVQKEAAENSYNVEEYRYVPVVIEDIDGSYSEVPNTSQAEFNAIISFLVPANQNKTLENVLVQENMQNVIQTIDDMRKGLIAEKNPIGNVGYQLFYDEWFSVSDPDNEEYEYIDLSITPNGGSYVVLETDNLTVGYNENDIYVETETKSVSFSYEASKSYAIEIYNDGDALSVDVGGVVKTIQGTKIETAASGIKVYAFDGRIYYLGVKSETTSDTYDRVLIENFDTLKNNSSQTTPIPTITKTDDYGATPLGDDGDVSVSFGMLAPTTNDFTYGNDVLTYQIFDLTVEFTYSENIFTGNDYKYFLDGLPIYPISKNFAYEATSPSRQITGTATATTKVDDNSMGHSFVIYGNGDHKVHELRKHLYSKTKSQNKEYELTIEFPTFKESYMVRIRQGGQDLTYNSPDTLSFDVVLSQL